jgi:hypothetical protein
MPLTSYLGRTGGLVVIVVAIVVAKRFLPGPDVIGAAVVVGALLFARPSHRHPTITPAVVAGGRRVPVGRHVVLSPLGIRERGRRAASCPWALFDSVSVVPQQLGRGRASSPVVRSVTGEQIVLGRVTGLRASTEVANAIMAYRLAMAAPTS